MKTVPAAPYSLLVIAYSGGALLWLARLEPSSSSAGTLSVIYAGWAQLLWWGWAHRPEEVRRFQPGTPTMLLGGGVITLAPVLMFRGHSAFGLAAVAAGIAIVGSGQRRNGRAAKVGRQAAREP